MQGNTRLDGGPGKARASFSQLLTALSLGLVMALVAVGCNGKPTEEPTGSNNAGTSVPGKGGEVGSGEVTPGPGKDTADERVGSKTGGG